MFDYDNVAAEMRALGDLQVPVATVKTLYRMKRGTVRWKDKVDEERLREAFHLEEE
ncbi:MAG: hypothetical protein ACYCW6_23370 [Candidatus Xenobia bacterium]